MLQAAAHRIWMALLINLVPALAVAGAPDANATHWICWYNNDTTVRCVLLQANADGDAAEGAVKIAQPAAGARPLPPEVRMIIRAEAPLLEGQVVVPLFSEPEGDAFVEQLANFTTCFGRHDCRVTFWRPREQLALLD